MLEDRVFKGLRKSSLELQPWLSLSRGREKESLHLVLAGYLQAYERRGNGVAPALMVVSVNCQSVRT